MQKPTIAMLTDFGTRDHYAGVMKGVVSGVRDYGNRMGIPTVNGAILFDERYLANPLVFCGTVGLLPVKCAKKEVRDGDLIEMGGGSNTVIGGFGADHRQFHFDGGGQRLPL